MGTFDVVVVYSLLIFMPQVLERVAVGCPHQLELLVNSVLLVVVKHELPVSYVLRHRYYINNSLPFQTLGDDEDIYSVTQTQSKYNLISAANVQESYSYTAAK